MTLLRCARLAQTHEGINARRVTAWGLGGAQCLSVLGSALFQRQDIESTLIWWCSGLACLVCNVLNGLRQVEGCLIRVLAARIPTNLSTRSVWSGSFLFAHGCEPLWVHKARTQKGLLELADSCESSLLPDSPGTTFLLGMAQISLKYLYNMCFMR